MSEETKHDLFFRYSTLDKTCNVKSIKTAKIGGGMIQKLIKAALEKSDLKAREKSQVHLFAQMEAYRIMQHLLNTIESSNK
jgi:hypothetical protein